MTSSADPATRRPALRPADRRAQPGAAGPGHRRGSRGGGRGVRRAGPEPAGLRPADRVAGSRRRRPVDRDRGAGRAAAGCLRFCRRASRCTAAAALLAALLLLSTLAAAGERRQHHRRRRRPGGAGLARRGVLDHRRLRRARDRRRSCSACAPARPLRLLGRRSPSPGGSRRWRWPGRSTRCRSPANTRPGATLFAAALGRHVALVAGSVGPALAIGFPLGVAAVRRAATARRRSSPCSILLQTVPSIALFGLLIVPLSALAAALPGLARARHRRHRPGAGDHRAGALCAAADRAQHRGRDRRHRPAP